MTPETLRRIRRIDLRTRRLVNESFAGAYQSVFKGRGIAFDAVRPYQPGDDIRDIEWNVTARADEAFVKQYREERELTVIIALDASASLSFGTVQRQKRELAAELGAVLAYAAITNNDRVGLFVFTDRSEAFIAPRKGHNHVLRLIRELLAVRPVGRSTDIAFGLRSLNRLLKQRAIIFLLSDFLAASEEYRADLYVTSRRHEVIAVVLSDPRERWWPEVGLITLEDAETGLLRYIDTSSAWRQQFSHQSGRFESLRDTTLARAGVDRINVSADGDYVQALTEFFRRRAKRVGRG
ncbi:DUF58 domain-containing protein [bacterium]|nr:DUF58 domain-containing protein [bacterium]